MLKLLFVSDKAFYSLLALLLALCALLFAFRQAAAFTMSNANYIIEMGNFNTGAGQPSNSNYKATVTIGQTAPGLYSGTNYKVKAGFEYIYPFTPFSFTISQTLIDFGILSPTNPVTRTNLLTVSTSSSYGYAVTGYENHQLLVPSSGAIIPDTTCDNGLCTETTPAAWTNTLTYGFGFRCDNVSGTDCSSDFATSTDYKQFADNSKGETPQTVMSDATSGKNRQSQITYKVNISGTQAAGSYTNVVTYIATPTY